MTKPTTLLMVGQVRLPERFLNTISLARRLMAEGVLAEAVMVAWCGELDRYDGLRPILQEAGFRIIEPPEPQIESRGNIWRQMVAYAVGLAHVKTLYVLKSRPDVFLAEPAIRRLVSDSSRKPDSGLPPTPFIERVWAPWMELSLPFCIADECFFATLQDAWLLHNIDLSYDAMGMNYGISHVRRFVHPFRHHDETRLFLARYSDAWLHSDERFSRLQARLKEPDYIRVLCWYYAIVRHCFDIYTAPGDIEFRVWSPPNVRPAPDVMPLAAHFTQRLGCPPHGRNLYCYDDGFIDAIATGVYDRDWLGQILSAGIRNYEREFAGAGAHQESNAPRQDAPPTLRLFAT